MIVTVDTNVIFSALYSQQGASHAILRLILAEEIQLAISVPVFFEYYDVLNREKHISKLGFKPSEIEDILDLLVILAQKHSIYYPLRPNLPDENDNIFTECAFAGESQYLITSNIKYFRKTELRGFACEVVTPKDFMNIWRGQNG